MIRLLHSFWVFVCNFVFSFLGSTIGFFYRLLACKDIGRNQSELSLVSTQNRDDYGSCGSGNSELDDFDINNTGFQFTNSYFVDKIYGENESSVFQTVPITSTSKYEFLSRKDISGFVKEQKVFTLTVHEPCLRLDNHEISHDGVLENGFCVDDDNREPELKTEFVGEERAEDIVDSFIVEKTKEKAEDSSEIFIVEKLFEKKVEEKEETESICTEEAEESFESFTIEKKLEEKDQENPTGFCSVEEEETINRRIIKGLDSITYEFIESEDVCKGFEYEHIKLIDEKEEKTDEETRLFGTRNLEPEAGFWNDHLIVSDSEFIELKPQMENSGAVEEEMLVMEDSEEAMSHEEIRKAFNSSEEFEEPNLHEEQSTSNCEEEDDDDDDDPDSMFEYDDVIEQLKMELKNARTGGLPTIDEESESPRMVEELKPLKIDVKIEHKDRMIEIQKVYRSYWDKMKKLDILNSQTIHAINLLKLKDQTQSNVTKKSLNRAAKSLMLQKLLSFKQRKCQAEPIQKLFGDVCKDFETVYVGNICLSWEMLHWQFRKVLELLQHDHQAIHQYNQVAGDFQLFQVLLERFIENEPFQGLPRVENYVKNRHVSHNFLQVPLIRDDGLKCSKGRSSVEKENMVAAAALRGIIWESICVFWRFLRLDKHETDLGLKGPNQTQVAPQGTLDLDLLLEIKADLQKKEKRLKDILRSGSCKAKKFQKHDVNHVVLITRIELKLISRVLCMPKLTADQLLWCHRKLHRINFSSRKIHLEPLFSLFPR